MDKAPDRLIDVPLEDPESPQKTFGRMRIGKRFNEMLALSKSLQIRAPHTSRNFWGTLSLDTHSAFFPWPYRRQLLQMCSRGASSQYEDRKESHVQAELRARRGAALGGQEMGGSPAPRGQRLAP